MKALKIILVCLGIIFLILFFGIYYVVHFVDINKHIADITAQVSKDIGRDIKTGEGRLTFSWDHGILFELKDVEIADDPEFSSKPFFRVGRVLLGVDLKAIILERKLSVSEIEVDSPSIVLIRNKSGLMNVMTIAPAKGSEASGAADVQEGAPSGPSSSAIPALMIGRISIVNGMLSVVDNTFSPPMDLRLDRLDLALRDISLFAPFSFDLKCRVFSLDQNMFLNGEAAFDQEKTGLKLGGVRFRTDLSKISLKTLNEALPMLTPVALKDPLGGDVSLVVGKALVSAQGLLDLQAEATLSQGRFLSGLMPVPIENVAIKANIDTKQITVASFTADFAGGKFGGNAVVDDYMALPKVSVTVHANEIEARKVSEAYKLPVRLAGKTFLKGSLSFSGTSPDVVLRSLQGDLSGYVLEGSLEGVNIIEQGLRNVSVLPGLWEAVQNALPPETQEDIKKGVTLIERCDLEATIQGGIAEIKKADLVARDFLVSAKGRADLAGDVNAKGDFYISSKVSDSLVGKVKDLGSLYDEKGRIYIPVLVTGPLVKPNVGPDTDYLTQKIIVNKGKEELQKVLDKNPEVQGLLNMILGGASSQDESTATSSAAEGSGQDAPNTEPKQVTADQAVDTILNLFKRN